MPSFIIYTRRHVFYGKIHLSKIHMSYIWDLSGLFSISSLVQILMMSLSPFSLLFVLTSVCPYDKNQITRWLEGIKKKIQQKFEQF